MNCRLATDDCRQSSNALIACLGMWSRSHSGCGEWWSTRSADRWEREVAVVGVRQAHGGSGSAVNAAVSAAEKPRPAKQGW
jgi:hypothetical protein